MSLKDLPQLELFNSPLVNKALNKLTGSSLTESSMLTQDSIVNIKKEKKQTPIIKEEEEEKKTSNFQEKITKKDSFDCEHVYQKLLQGIKDFFNKNNFKEGVIGLSGGVDSTLTFKLCVDALGSNKVTALLMPEISVTKQENIIHSKKLAEYFETKVLYQPINPFLLDYKALPWQTSKTAQMNTKARIRMNLLYSYANSFSACVFGTSNRSEIMLGYGTKHGDLACDVEIIGELYKTEVYKLGEHLGLPREILNKKPSAELCPGQTDEDELGANYDDLDAALKMLPNGPEAGTSKGIDPNLSKHVWELIQKNQHKSQLPPTIDIS